MKSHKFAGVSSEAVFADDSEVARQWPLRKTECSVCGLPRLMSMFTDPTRVYAPGCPGDPRPWYRKLFRRGR